MAHWTEEIDWDAPLSNTPYDQILAEIYLDKHIRATAIIPGTKTLKQFPTIPPNKIIFKKEYLTLSAPPLKRGETPEKELQNVKKILRAIPEIAIPQGYAATDTIYYGQIICGRELEKASPFPENVEHYLNPCKPPRWGWKRFLQGLCFLHKQIQTLHKYNITHDDLHTGNILLSPRSKFYVIDLGSATFHKSTPTNRVKDDLIEIEREITLTAYHSQTPLPPLVNSLEDMFPEEISKFLSKKLQKLDNPNQETLSK